MLRLRIHRLLKAEPNAAERARIEALLQGYSRYIRDQFRLFLDSARHPDVLAEVELALREDRLKDALSIVDSYVVRFGDAVVAQVPSIGRAEAEALASQTNVASSGMVTSFNPTASDVVAAMQRNRLEFIRDFTADQRLAVNQALSRAAEQGLGPVETAREFRDAIGLTSYQQGMVERYRGLLEANNARALDYQLRDRRYDRGLENAIDGDYILPADRIDTMVDRYRERLLQLRSETIARTEAGRVAEETRNIAVEQMIEQAGIDRGYVVKQWMATVDNRTRDSHQEMNGQARLLDDAFDSPSGAALMYPHDRNAPAEEVINCRCTPSYHIFDSAAEVKAFLLENGQGYYDDDLA